MAAPKIYFGTVLFNADQGYKSAEDVKPWLDALLESKDAISGVDTAVAFRECQDYLGQLNFASHFSISTKVTGGAHPMLTATKDNVLAQAKDCLNKLGVEQVDVLYLQAPDARVPFEETLAAIDGLYKEGVFKRFGISNHTGEQIEQVVQICQSKGFVVPSVFQGSYNAIARLPETQLLPVLRKHNIAFVAYSPIAGGFFAKTSQQFRDQSLQGRWNKAGLFGKLYQFQYNKPAALEALDKWHEIAKAEGISGVEMAYRWLAHNSALDASKGDGMIIGASNVEQWKSNLAAIKKGPLSAAVAAKIGALWAPLEAGSVLDNFHAVKALMGAGPPK
ncbi:hypothetical protein H634G_04917 [Metarhizium anisopliae BRIP 53293]|uniref:NADP-dependent oxidoreductase domain-containing protein n=1 Tax=Metarhizium anisopliae BRIP 53293 TaxID=1291518 RepID=A0A0D9NZQ8_METAN|nr:hypothetical protein H634G_04917 [Metarhizium anisopliae BRIP 53293]KJK87753.1 hypothetical protein H633G_08388 [Metarhizium anisopliae BRIP 53284]